MTSQVTKVVKQAVSTAVGLGSDTLVVKVAQDFYLADAQYKVLVDGQQVGGVFSVSATVNSGSSDTLTLNGDWGGGAHNVQVVFLNDAYSAVTHEDRNLLVSSVSLNGTTLTGDGSWLWSNGARTFTGTIAPRLVNGTINADTLTGTTGDDIITGGRGNDTLYGNGGHDTFITGLGNGWDTIKDFSVSGANSDVIQLDGYMISSFDDVKHHLVQWGNDTLLQLGNSAVKLINVSMSSLTAANFSFVNAVAAPAAVNNAAGSGSDKLVIKLTQDYYAGDNAKFTVSVDGVQVGGVFSASAVRMSGQQDTLTLSGDWGAGTHKVTINFLNDAFNAVTLEDRNLMIESVTMNGASVAGASNLMSHNGAYSFLTTIAALAGAAPSAPAGEISIPATHEIFDYARADGAKVLTSFDATGDGSDVLRINNYGLVNQHTPTTGTSYTSFADLKGHIVQSGLDTVIQLSSTDAITLKNVNASDLTASNFVFSSKLDGAMQYDANNGWIVFNNTWGSGDFTYGKDYTLTTQYDVDHLTTGTTFTWNYGDARYNYTKVLGYPSVMYGSDTFNNAGGVSDPAKALPVQVADLDKFSSTYDVSWGGDAKGYDVSYDIWLTNKPNGDWSNITNEVMIWLHKGEMSTYGDLVGTYSDGTYSAKIYHTGTYTALVPDKDYTAGEVNIADVFKALTALGIVSGKEYVNQIDLGAEPWEGSGSLTINSLSYDIKSHDATGIVTEAHADGGATQVTKIGTAQADSISADGAKIATLTGGAGNDTFVFTKGQTGAITVTDFHAYTTAAAEHDVLNFTGYGSGATLTHDSGDNWTVHYAGGEDHLVLQGITSLSTADYHFL